MIRDERTASATVAIDAEEIAVRARELGGVLRAQDEPWLRSLGDRDLLALLPRLLPAAASLATAPISGFNVGAIAVSGAEFDRRLYFGANLEIARAGLSSAVHAEQSAIVNAWMHDEPSISHLAISAAPCGHCRQFLYELVAAESLKLVWPGEGGRVETRELRALLPEAFGPQTLGVHARLLGDASALPTLVLQDSRNDPARERALEAATKSYAPYTHGRAGCALETSAGRMFVGRYAENAAYNPSLSAGQTALAMMNLAPRREGERITRAVLVERAGSVTQLPAIACFMEAAAPGVEVERFEANEAVSRQ